MFCKRSIIVAATLLLISACGQEPEEMVFKNTSGEVLEGKEARLAKLRYEAEKSKTPEDKIKEKRNKRMKMILVQKQRRGEKLTEEEQLMLKQGSAYLTPEERRKVRQEYRDLRRNDTRPQETN